MAGVFYGALCVAAATWLHFRALGFSFFGDPMAASCLLGLAAACLTVSLSLLAYRLLPVVRELAGELAPVVVDGMSRSALVLVSVFSGVGEELFFRGALQEEFGIVAASVVFGVAHFGPDRRYLLWTLWAVAAGFLFGFLYDFSGGLLAPMLAHALHNAATLLLWKRHRQSGKP